MGEKDLLDDWIQNQLSATTLRSDLMKESELREQSREFLSALREAVEHGNPTDIQSADWAGMRELLAKFREHSFSMSDFDGEQFVRLRTLRQRLDRVTARSEPVLV